MNLDITKNVDIKDKESDGIHNLSQLPLSEL